MEQQMVSLDPLAEWDADEYPEPADLRLVRGTAAFVTAVFLAVIALAIFAGSYFVDASVDKYLLREIAFAIGAFSLPLALLAVVLTLPANARAVAIAVAGVVICLVAIAFFSHHYPHNWNVSTNDATLTGMAIYAAGVLPVALTAGVALSLYVVERLCLLLLPEEVRADPELTRERVREHIGELVDDGSD